MAVIATLPAKDTFPESKEQSLCARRMLQEVLTPINWSIPRRSIFFKVKLAKWMTPDFARFKPC